MGRLLAWNDSADDSAGDGEPRDRARADAPVADRRRGFGGGQGRGGPGGGRRGGSRRPEVETRPGQERMDLRAGPGFQNAQVTATQTGQDALAAAAAGDADCFGSGRRPADEAFLVNGSTSGGLGAASDDFNRRRQQGGGRGGPGGPGGAAWPGGGIGMPPGMNALDAGNLGLGGLGAGD